MSAPQTSTYIAGYDGSDESRTAVEIAARLAAAAGARVVAVNVYQYASGSYWIGVNAMLYKELEAEYLARAERLVAGLDVPGVEKRALLADSPARGLHELAEELDAGLVAVGATHHGPLGRLAPGSVAMHLLHGAPCPVLVAPAGWRDRPIATIGVAYDGREESRAALHHAEQLADQLDAHLVLVGATQPLMVPAGVAPVVPAEFAIDAEKEFKRMLESAAAESRPGTETRAVIGPAARAVAGASGGFDLLVAGSRAYGLVSGVLLGSVSRHLVDHAHCPVMVVPRSTDPIPSSVVR